ncbi:uncharacterized phage protein (possible DNA packaging) [Alkalithermobacter thermoalcaliphilus JW-YL-7 = DSM 7308]|uniref:Putative phage DNA packaging-like protein n=1 Tax=Alkalithermobacter thermoalcaliphilus JW-YL-7 = DSM 7308 TaxID=1121328 RepID=A0A150FQY1_CLOPD|nr:putative phage DNA packaging-like protein [[Clostridium] paradoxum JW-YL-7 = DSM 7308]SHL13592.1 uncharacterized phage protein (possible DNA packaging) [[Clostridium] paradoxum JW-YL-7 = DSM 7308]
MILTVDEVKDFLKIDHEYDNQLIYSLIIAAENYIKNATGIEFDDSNELAKLAVKILVSHWYENREINTDKSSKLSFSIDAILTQLKYCYESNIKIEDD